MKRIVVESSYGSIWREIMEGITWFARDRRLAWNINCVTTQELSLALKLRPHAAICLLRPVQKELIRQLTASRIPAVNLLRDIHPGVPSVMSNNELIGERAADYLHSRGFRQYAFAGVNRIWSEERERGLRRRLNELGHKIHCCPLQLEVDQFRDGLKPAIRRNLKRWLCELPRPVALFACADFVGSALVETCRAANLAIPQEAAILGVDNDLSICDLASVPMSSIPQNMRRIGYEAARLLNGLMRNAKSAQSPLRIAPHEVVVRRSTDFIVAENPQIAAALRYISLTEADRLDMKGLLRQAGVCRQWLDRQFRQVIGTTPSEEIRRRKLACARLLLLETHLSVQEIAVRSGFTRGENLARFFKERVGMSPREFRLRHGFLK